jgi:hypothetical protein
MLTVAPVSAGSSFLDSDEYRQGKAVVGVLLTDDDYAKMVPDVVHLGAKLDWVWVVGQENSGKLDSLGFSVADYSSIVVQLPNNHSGEGGDWLPERTREVLMVNCKRVGWTPVRQGDLVLATAIVEASDADGFGPVKFFNATNAHHIEFEFKLTEATSGKTLLVARERASSANMVGAVWRGASRLARFLAAPKAPRYSKHGKTVALDLFELPGKKKTHKFEKYSDPRQILSGALTNSGIFEQVVEDSADTDYGLEVRVSQANIVGAYQTTINLLAVYTLKHRESGVTVAEEEIATSTTMSALEIRSGGKRLKAVVAAAFLDSADNFLFRLAAALNPEPSP